MTHKSIINSFNRFVKLSATLHGGTFDYSKVIYTGVKGPIEVTCTGCGTSKTTTPDQHKYGGCAGCKAVENADKSRYTITDFINKSKRIWGDKFDYSKVAYINNNTPVTIICPIHGEFIITPSSHWVSKTGCKQCGAQLSAEVKVIHTTESFIEASKLVHGDLYGYSNTVYHGMHELSTITCILHGDFEQRPENHLKGSGCQKCQAIAKGAAKRLTKTDFLLKAYKVHGDYYDYSKVKFNLTNEKVVIGCPEHGDFQQVVNAHLQGAGCSGCSKQGFDTKAPAILYYLSINNGEAYKIGITNRTVNKRFSNNDLLKITVLSEEYFEKGIDALNKETQIKREFTQYKHTGADLLESGNTELFTIDVLSLK